MNGTFDASFDKSMEFDALFDKSMEFDTSYSIYRRENLKLSYVYINRLVQRRCGANEVSSNELYYILFVLVKLRGRYIQRHCPNL